MRAIAKGLTQRLAKLEARASASDDANAFRQVIFLNGDDPEGDYPDGTVVVRFVSPMAGEFRLPHNGREAPSNYGGEDAAA